MQSLLLVKRALMQGFLIGDHASRFPEAREALTRYIREGRLRYEEHVVDGFAHTVDAFLGLFSGDNIGKQLVKVETSAS
ncbi:hypothetical protein IDH44_01125 [Paenibacillus sp. IB182496]|uniref:Uncharacterized protein n=1 Tax=Paenibacillus sabuli TaxID=2772509 RepID=A0A927BNG6_9BACL|nr:hypothetical protein [Paenibacillus sabuli]MBD2843778.1 hypothetical protein [Paenibacillus sabuli]